MKKKEKKDSVPNEVVEELKEESMEEPILNENPDTSIDPESEIKEQEVKLEGGNPSTEPPKESAEQELQDEIEKLKKENLDLIEKIKYSQAELVSYRMRKDEETASLLKYANQDLITEIIPLIDNFENALKLASKSNNPEIAKYLTGFQMMYTSLTSILNKYGVEEINRPGQIFDSKLEQAMVAESNPEMEDEVVLEVLQKGYKLKDRVIRPASVKINQL